MLKKQTGNRTWHHCLMCHALLYDMQLFAHLISILIPDRKDTTFLNNDFKKQ
jgi:hypothetical protein